MLFILIKMYLGVDSFFFFFKMEETLRTVHLAYEENKVRAEDVVQCREYQALGSTPSKMVHTCKSQYGEVDEGGSEVQGHP